MEKTFNELDTTMRETLKLMADLVRAEWIKYENGLLEDAHEAGLLTGEWKDDEPVLDTIQIKVRLEAAEQMQRNTSTWSGGAGEPNNVVEGIRHAIASEKFSGGLNYGLFKAYQELKG